MGELRVRHAPSNRPEWLGLRTFPFRRIGPQCRGQCRLPPRRHRSRRRRLPHGIAVSPVCAAYHRRGSCGALRVGGSIPARALPSRYRPCVRWRRRSCALGRPPGRDRRGGFHGNRPCGSGEDRAWFRGSDRYNALFRQYQRPGIRSKTRLPIFNFLVKQVLFRPIRRIGKHADSTVVSPFDE